MNNVQYYFLRYTDFVGRGAMVVSFFYGMVLIAAMEDLIKGVYTCYSPLWKEV